MNRIECLITALALCVLLASCTQAQNDDDLDGEEESAVTIALTKFEVNVTELKLSWKIRNNTDHDVWICSSLSARPAVPFYETLLDRDGETLIIRRRFGLSIEEGIEWHFPFRKAQYVRLSPGQEKAESVSFPLPVSPNHIFARSHANAEYAGRLALEIGFFNEDLRELILRAVELAEILFKPDPQLPSGYVWDNELVTRFFGGWAILKDFDRDLLFRDTVTSGEGPIMMPYLDEILGEQFLRIEVDGVSIPYSDDYFPLSSQGAKSTKDQQSRDTNKSNKDQPAREKG